MRLFLFYITSILFLSACSTNIPSSEQISLNGDWKFRQVGKKTWVKATVPGVVQLDLLHAGLIEDPFYGTQEEDIAWVELENWEYQKDIELSAVTLEQEVIELVFEGLDTYAEVYVNEQRILKADNMFCQWRVNCKPYLHTGKNKIRVLFKSPIKEKTAAYQHLPYQLPAGNDTKEPKVSPFVRKAPYHFGWDWGPRIVTMGIWRPVRLEAYSFVKIHDVYFEQQDISAQKASIQAQIKAEYLENSQEELELTIKLNNEVLQSLHISPKKGIQNHLLDIAIDQPKLWWCNGLGEPHLYPFTIELKKGQQLLYSETQNIGLRKIELIQEQDSIGTSYYFKLNDQPIFIKGANYIPQDNLLPRVQAKDYDKSIQNAVDAHMNMLRVWGGGIYEDDYFYERCNEKGILVWQDFMFACSMYPSDTAFVQNVQREIEQNVRRLRKHTAVALWCGNNEMEVAWNNWGWQKQFGYSPKDSTQIIQGYQKIFHQLIPQTLAQLNTHLPYVSTSPLSNWGKAENFNHQSMHYWGVWHGREPFEHYSSNVGRFMSEYGFQSFPAMPTIQAFADSSQWKLTSTVMQHHQKSYIGNGMIEKHLETYYPKPTSFPHFVYLSQLTQAYGIALAIQHHRQSKGHCMGTLYWQLNDCWPGPSWSSVDYFGRWKALHYKVRDLYKNVLLSAKELEGNRLQVDLVSDQRESIKGNLVVETQTFDGQSIQRFQKENIVLEFGQTGLSFDYDIANLLQDAASNAVVLRLSFENKEIHYQQLYYFEAPKDLALKQAQLTTQLEAIPEGYQLKMQSNSLVKNLYVSTKTQGNWSDNYFDLLPHQEKIIVLKTTDVLTKEAIQFLSVNDLILQNQ